jgi:hypothetical protein
VEAESEHAAALHETWLRQQREQLQRRDFEVVKRERDQLHARVGHQRRELAALSRAQWTLCEALRRRGWALSLLGPMLRVLVAVDRKELQQTAELDGGWPSALARLELERRKHWHYVIPGHRAAQGLDLDQLPTAPTDAPSLEQTG